MMARRMLQRGVPRSSQAKSDRRINISERRPAMVKLPSIRAIAAILTIALLLISAPGARAQQREEAVAVTGSPFGVGKLTVALPQGVAVSPQADNVFTLTEKNGRVLYPAYANTPVRGLLRNFLDRPQMATVYFLFTGDGPLDLRLYAPGEIARTVSPVNEPSLHRRLLSDWWREYTAAAPGGPKRRIPAACRRLYDIDVSPSTGPADVRLIAPPARARFTNRNEEPRSRCSPARNRRGRTCSAPSVSARTSIRLPPKVRSRSPSQWRRSNFPSRRRSCRSSRSRCTCRPNVSTFALAISRIMNGFAPGSMNGGAIYGTWPPREA